MRKPSERMHREWFRTVMEKRKSCPSCGEKLLPGESVWSWGEYVRAKWRTVQHFCKKCWEDTPNGFAPGLHKGIRSKLREHAGVCGCTFELVAYRGQKLPEWMSLGEEVCNETSKNP